jgi:hypothetical protein
MFCNVQCRKFQLVPMLERHSQEAARWESELVELLGPDRFQL